jgi:hypothetical protein
MDKRPRALARLFGIPLHGRSYASPSRCVRRIRVTERFTPGPHPEAVLNLAPPRFGNHPSPPYLTKTTAQAIKKNYSKQQRSNTPINKTQQRKRKTEHSRTVGSRTNREQLA